MGIIDFLINGWRKLLAYIGIAALVFALGGYTGYQYRDGQEAKKEVAAVIQQVDSKESNQKVADKSGERIAEKQAKTRIIYKTIEKEVIKYVQTNPDAASDIGPDWVRLHDAAARGEPVANPVSGTPNPVPQDGTDRESPSQ